MQALALIEKVKQTYAKSFTYSDFGTATTVDDKAPKIMQFRTYFKRPNLFRFEWTDDRQSSFVCHDGTTAIISGNGKRDVCADWKVALARAVGVSNGAIAVILGALLEDWGGKPLLNLTALELVEDEALYLLTGRSATDNKVELWIDRDFLLQRVRQSLLLTVEKQRLLLAQAAEEMAARGRKLQATLEPDAADRSLVTEYCFKKVVRDGDIADSIFRI